MRLLSPLLIGLFCFLQPHLSSAQIRWDEPEVVPEKLTRRDRRVIRFSGRMKPEALVRIRKDQIKIYPDEGSPRLAQIPQKNRVQFPVKADSEGRFSFNLYLPTTAVEIPLEIKNPKKSWAPQTLNFRVPERGRADDFRAIEESFRDQDARMDNIELDQNFYSRKSDRGLVIQDREGRQVFAKSPFEVWAGVGVSYFRTAVGVPAPVGDTSDGGLVIPSFRLGGDWDYSERWRFRANLRSSSGSLESIGDANTQGRSFSWFEAQGGALWFNDFLKSWGGRAAFDFGLQLQTLPLFRLREDPNLGPLANSSFFSNNTYNLQIGFHYEDRKKQEGRWDYEVYARYLYPVMTGDEFSVTSALPLFFELGGGIRRPLTAGLSMGVFAQMHYVSMDVEYTAGGVNFSSDLSLLLMTVDARLIGHF